MVDTHVTPTPPSPPSPPPPPFPSIYQRQSNKRLKDDAHTKNSGVQEFKTDLGGGGTKKVKFHLDIYTYTALIQMC